MSSHSPYKKRREAVVIGLEATRGGTATPDYAVEWYDKGIDTKVGILENEGASGDDYRVNDSAIGTKHSEGPLSAKVAEFGITWFERLIMTKMVTTDNGDDTYTHEFSYDPLIEPKSASLWDVKPSGTRRYRSVVLDNLDIEVEAGENGAWIMASSATKGWPHENVAAITPEFVVSEQHFTNAHMKIYLADNEAGLADTAASRVLARRFKLSRQQTKTADHNVGDIGTPEFDKGVFEANGELMIKYRKTDYEEGYFTNKVWAMKVVIADGDFSAEYLATKVRFREKTDSDGRDDTVTQTFTLAFESDRANDGHVVRSTITNALATLTNG